jgi:hypothetical protein
MPGKKLSEAVSLRYEGHGNWRLSIDDRLFSENIFVDIVNRPDPRNYRILKTRKHNYQMT